MWQVFKAEIDYIRLNLFYVLVVSSIGFLFLHFWPALFGPAPTRNVGYISICYMYFYFVMALLILPWDKERRRRLLAVLPIPIRQISSVHLVLCVLYWMEILALFVIFVGLSPQFLLDSKTGIALLTQTGMIFIVYGCLGLMSVFPDSVWRKAGEVSLLFIFALIATAGIVQSFQRKDAVYVVDRILSWLYQSLSGSLCVLFLGIAAVSLVLFFPWRRSYAGR